MGVEQVIVNGLDNLEESVFEEVFGELNEGILYFDEFSVRDEIDYYTVIPPPFDNFRLLIVYRPGRYNYANEEKKFIYYSIPKELNHEETKLLIKNYYLSFISDIYLKLNDKEILYHKINDCVNSVMFYFNEKLEKIDKRLLRKSGLCIDCHRRFKLEVKDSLINGLPSLLSTGYASSSQSFL
jgi:hypothetical protein